MGSPSRRGARLSASGNIAVTSASLPTKLNREEEWQLPLRDPQPARFDASRGWLQFAIPSAADLVFVILLLGFSIGPLAISLLGDGGTGWHIRTGEWILKAHAVPRVDLFSTTMQGKPWYAWEWLYDVAAGALHQTAGLNGVVLFTAIVIAVTFALVLRRLMARGANLPVAVLLLLLAFLASTVHFLARPHVFSWLFTVIWFEILETFEAEGRARMLLWLPPLILVWVNVHGGFLVGLILLAIYAASDMASAAFSNNAETKRSARSRARRLVFVGVVAGLATLCNPYGYGLYIHIKEYLGDPFLMHHIDEFLAPRFHGVAQRCFAVLTALAVVTMVASWGRLALRHWLILLFAIASGFYAVRNIPVSSILIVLVAAPYISGALHERAKNREHSVGRAFLIRLDSFGFRMARFDETLRGHFWPAMVTLSLVAICLSGGTVAGLPVVNAHFDEKRYPVRAIDFLSHEADARPVYTLDRWGGYLIYREYPEVVTAVDDRHDLYGAGFLRNYLKIVRGESGWDAALESLHPRSVLVPSGSPLSKLLGQDGAWRMVYQDQTAVLFKNTTTPEKTRAE